MRNKVVLCDSCGKESETDEIMKSCGNCFGCVGCEIYICPYCDSQIVVKPLVNPPGKQKI